MDIDYFTWMLLRHKFLLFAQHLYQKCLSLVLRELQPRCSSGGVKSNAPHSIEIIDVRIISHVMKHAKLPLTRLALYMFLPLQEALEIMPYKIQTSILLSCSMKIQNL